MKTVAVYGAAAMLLGALCLTPCTNGADETLNATRQEAPAPKGAVSVERFLVKSPRTTVAELAGVKPRDRSLVAKSFVEGFTSGDQWLIKMIESGDVEKKLAVLYSPFAIEGEAFDRDGLVAEIKSRLEWRLIDDGWGVELRVQGPTMDEAQRLAKLVADYTQSLMNESWNTALFRSIERTERKLRDLQTMERALQAQRDTLISSNNLDSLDPAQSALGIELRVLTERLVDVRDQLAAVRADPNAAEPASFVADRVSELTRRHDELVLHIGQVRGQLAEFTITTLSAQDITSDIQDIRTRIAMLRKALDVFEDERDSGSVMERVTAGRGAFDR